MPIIPSCCLEPGARAKLWYVSATVDLDMTLDVYYLQYKLSLSIPKQEPPSAQHFTSVICAQVMQRVIAELEAKYNVHEGKPTVGIVRLTGLAHTEDVAAFREIARQLCKYAAT